MERGLIFAILGLIVIIGTFIFVIYTIQNEINNLSDEQLQSVKDDPFMGIRAVSVFVGSVMVGAFIYSFWWYPKKCIEYESKVLKENKEHMEKMENLEVR